MDDENVALVLVRQLASLPFYHAWVTDDLTDQHIISVRTKEGGVVFPLALRASDGELELSNEAHPNFDMELARPLIESARETQPPGAEQGSIAKTILSYIYALLYSESYRVRYAEFLKADFPRIFVPKDTELFASLAQLGEALIGLHLLRNDGSETDLHSLIGSKPFEIEKVSYSDHTVWLDESKSSGFAAVDPKVWAFEIGGYQVCHKWLKDRKGRTLTKEDIAHYQKIIVALSETIRIMAEIDEVIEASGGWPGAFKTEGE